jgi:hypothetical protein
VIASEQIGLFGLVLAPSAGALRLCRPAGAHAIFVEQALVTGEIDTGPGSCAAKTLEQAGEEEAKLRRAGLVADEGWQARWYATRIPRTSIRPPSSTAGGRRCPKTAREPALVVGRPAARRGRGGPLSEIPAVGRCAACAALPLRAGRE